MTDRPPAFDYDAWAAGVVRGTDRRFGYDGETGPAFETWRAEFRDALRGVLGFPAIRAAGESDLDPRRHAATTVSAAGTATHERQTWSVRSEPGVRVPFHLLVPESADPPYPVVLALHGHAERGKELAVGAVEGEAARRHVAEERRDIARQAVERGYAALAPDVRGFGELTTRAGEGADDSESKPCVRWQKTAQLVGRSLVGERVWDARRLASFVERRPELDADRLALTGHSGGGTAALFAAALDDRFSPVVPCASVCPFEDALVPREHCLCNYVPGVRRHGEIWDVAGLIAPRPLRVVAGEDDSLFPIEGTRRAADRIRAIYRGAGAAGDFGLFVGDGGHRFYPGGAWPFVDRHL